MYTILWLGDDFGQSHFPLGINVNKFLVSCATSYLRGFLYVMLSGVPGPSMLSWLLPLAPWSATAIVVVQFFMLVTCHRRLLPPATVHFINVSTAYIVRTRALVCTFTFLFECGASLICLGTCFLSVLSFRQPCGCASFTGRPSPIITGHSGCLDGRSLDDGQLRACRAGLAEVSVEMVDLEADGENRSEWRMGMG